VRGISQRGSGLRSGMYSYCEGPRSRAASAFMHSAADCERLDPAQRRRLGGIDFECGPEAADLCATLQRQDAREPRPIKRDVSVMEGTIPSLARAPPGDRAVEEPMAVVRMDARDRVRKRECDSSRPGRAPQWGSRGDRGPLSLVWRGVAGSAAMRRCLYGERSEKCPP